MCEVNDVDKMNFSARKINFTAEVIIALEQALEEKLGSTEWEWESRSVIGEDGREDPIWSLQLFVKTKKKGI